MSCFEGFIRQMRFANERYIRYIREHSELRRNHMPPCAISLTRGTLQNNLLEGPNGKPTHQSTSVSWQETGLLYWLEIMGDHFFDMNLRGETRHGSYLGPAKGVSASRILILIVRTDQGRSGEFPVVTIIPNCKTRLRRDSLDVQNQ